MRRPLVITLSFLLPATLACPPRYSVWVVPQSSPDFVVFGLAPSREGTNAQPLDWLAVYPCETRYSWHAGWELGDSLALWKIRADRDTVSRPGDSALSRKFLREWMAQRFVTGRIVYGELPRFFVEMAPPRHLEPGRCYYTVVSSLGYGLRGFMIARDGSVGELTDDQFERMSGFRY
jgi:hypothetical protein